MHTYILVYKCIQTAPNDYCANIQRSLDAEQKYIYKSEKVLLIVLKKKKHIHRTALSPIFN